jgi:hypothetical protein
MEEDENFITQGGHQENTQELALGVSPTSQDLVQAAIQVSEKGIFSMLPSDLLKEMFSYVGSKGMAKVRQLNKAFYQLTTGYERPGVVGVGNKSQVNIPTGYWAINNRKVDFKGVVGLTRENIPCFPFFQLVGEVSSLPQTFWPYLQSTSVHTVNLYENQIGDSGAIELGKHLQGTNIQTLDLRYNELSRIFGSNWQWPCLLARTYL